MSEAQAGVKTKERADEREEFPEGLHDPIHTHVGSIPADWVTKQLRQLGYFLKGNGVKQEESNGGSLPCVRYGDIYKYHDDHVRKFHSWISQEVATKATRLQHGDILFAGSGETKEHIGKCAALVTDSEAYAGGDVVILRLTDADVYSQFLGYALNAPIAVRQKSGFGQGDAVVHINAAALGQVKIPIPPIIEQRAIAKILSDVDRLLESLDELIEKKHAIKLATMQQLLSGNTRLSGFNKSWETWRLQDLGTLSKGKGIRRDDLYVEGPACIRYGELYTLYSNYILTAVSRVRTDVAEAALPIQTGDLLFAGSGETAEEIGRCAAYVGDEPAYAGGDIIVLTPLGHDSLYLGHLMNYSSVAKQKARLAQGDAVVHINPKNLAQIEVALPPQDEQRAITAILSDMDAEIAALEARYDKASAIRKGMMQQLLSGRFRLV